MWTLAVSLAAAGWLVDAGGAQALVDAGATVLDVRSGAAFRAGHVPGAQPVSWRIGVVGGLRSGELGDPTEVAADFAALGVSGERPVLVVGDWEGSWGEEGRIAWDLAYLGHPAVSVLVGGFAAWEGPAETAGQPPRPGDFAAHPHPELRADTEAVASGARVVVDVREPDEYAGTNWYLARHGGHVPGAANFPWRVLVGAPAILPRAPLTVYCTGGVRAGMAWLWLTSLGYDVAMYDGSWWAWAEVR